MLIQTLLVEGKKIFYHNQENLRNNDLTLKQIFVFGSNESGFHGGGAAFVAHVDFGAIHGIGLGPQGRSFAIPTKDWAIKTLPLEFIEFYVDRFIEYTQNGDNKNTQFVLTRIGVGLAGFTDEDIAPLFQKALFYNNIIFPKKFLKVFFTW